MIIGAKNIFPPFCERFALSSSPVQVNSGLPASKPRTRWRRSMFNVKIQKEKDNV